MSSIKHVWRKILKDIYEKGEKHHKDDAEIKEILNISVFIDNPGVYMGPVKGTLSRGSFLAGIRQGYYDIDGYEIKGEALADYVESIDNPKRIHIDYDEGSDFVYTYPERLKAIPVAPKYDNFMVEQENQLEHIIERLRMNKGSNRAVATLYNVGLDPYWIDDIPCLNWMQALIRDDMLYLAVMFRSNDIYNAFPSNMFLLMNIGYYITEELQKEYPNLYFVGIYYNCTSAHYYTDVVTDDIIKEIIK